jgi:hypothetical protein
MWRVSTAIARSVEHRCRLTLVFRCLVHLEGGAPHVVRAMARAQCTAAADNFFPGSTSDASAGAKKFLHSSSSGALRHIASIPIDRII